MRPRAQSYHTLDGLSAGRNAVRWYWRLLALSSSIFILGGFLMLPATFEKDPKSQLKTSVAAVGIVAVALLAAGFACTALVSFAVQNPLFQADAVYLPACTSCEVGLLTVLYDFIVFQRYTFSTPAVLVTVAGVASTMVYGGLFIWMQRRITTVKSDSPIGLRTQPGLQPSLHHTSSSQPILQQAQPTGSVSQQRGSESTLWQDTSYYENYNRNMFPTAQNTQRPEPAEQGQQQPAGGFDPHSITEDEMQRQQMLMLLLQNEQQTSAEPSTRSTYNIEWQSQDEVVSPERGYYAPAQVSNVSPRTAYPETAYPQTAYPQTARSGPSPLINQWPNNMQPWDGVWRTPATVGTGIARPSSREFRDARRQEIEAGRR